MSIHNMLIKYYSVAGGEGGDGGGSGSGASEITLKIQELTDEQVSVQASGLKDENSGLPGKLKESTESLKRFRGIDPDVVKAILQRFFDDEKTQLIATGKIDEVLDKRTERLRADVDRQIKAANERVEKVEAFSNKLRDHVLGDAIRNATLRADALPEASDDLILRARGTFQLNGEGEAVAVDTNDDVLFSKGGKTPLTPVEQAESLGETAPYLFPRAEGSGAGGHESGDGDSSLKRSEISSSDKVNYIRKHGQRAYFRLPK